MSIKSFRVENQKGLRLAVCDQVPPIMVIAGPNGVGKSTLLHSLHRRQGGVVDDETLLIYQPPHRAIRRQQVRRRFLGGGIRRLLDIFAGSDVSGFEGLSIPFPSRAPDNVDEAGSTIKYTLGKIENRRQLMLASLVDRHRESGELLNASALHDPYLPLRKLIDKLLPHLGFKRVDFSDEENIKCVFERKDTVATNDLDLDDLSSGEKSIIILFLPLIENEINLLLDSLVNPGATTRTAGLPNRVFLIDEPEQHLHPDLQARILGYLREEVARQSLQFIVATHSPTLVDQAFDNELYLLTFPQKASENQLRRVATSSDRLEALKMLTGSTYLATTGRSIVCLEGARDPDSTRPTDVRLLEILYPKATRYTFVPVGGKGNVVNVVQGLRANLPEEYFGIRVLGIVDMDRSRPIETGIVSWPVCTIENLLLNAEAIVQSLQTVTGNTTWTAEKVETLIKEAAREQREEEIRLRVMEAIGARTLRIKGLSVAEVKDALKQELQSLRMSDEQVERIIEQATAAVDRALQDESFVRVFRGKELLRGTYRRLGLERKNIGFERFTYSLAKACAEVEEVRELLHRVFEELERQDIQTI